jgi:DNA-binding transcriptional MerR regulator
MDLGLPGENNAYGLAEVVEHTRLTARQLDYWATKGIFEPSLRNDPGKGNARLYSFRDLVALRVLKRLIGTGVAVDKVGRAVQTLRHLGERDLAGVVLASDGATVYQVMSDGELTDLARGGQGVFLIAVKDTLKGLREDLAAPAPVIDLNKRRGKRA